MIAPALNGHALEAPVTLALCRVRADDLPYVRNSFAEGHKGAPGVASMTWRPYKQYIVPVLNRVLAQPGVELRAAYLGQELVGWLALSRGGRVDTIHWVHTKYQTRESGESMRRRGVMTALIDSAELGNRIVYTWRGAYATSNRDKRTVDERLVTWLAKRGQHAAYVPWEDWIQ